MLIEFVETLGLKDTDKILENLESRVPFKIDTKTISYIPTTAQKQVLITIGILPRTEQAVFVKYIKDLRAGVKSLYSDIVNLYALMINLSNVGSIEQLRYLDTSRDFDPLNDIVDICIVGAQNLDFWQYFLAKLSPASSDRLIVERAGVLKSQFIAKTLALAFLFNKVFIYSYILRTYEIDENSLFDYLLEYLPAISEYNMDLMIKHLRFVGGAPFQLNSDFILTVGQTDARTYKILEMYISDEDLKAQLRSQIPGLL